MTYKGLSNDFMLGQIYERTRCLPGLVSDMDAIKRAGCRAFPSQGGMNDKTPPAPSPITPGRPRPVSGTESPTMKAGKVSINLRGLDWRAQIVIGVAALFVIVALGAWATGAI